ncbi:Hsp20 family protein [Rhizobium cremeum]|uniref:Hsp20 family protein n=1 Tax=Rhizobium cremeum TaxID=2813827 RepID=UPI001FD097FC|nr:Hsp20 family protein [Rhizobium cremeum]MCJ7995053.1 Hsp20 family protein [Rhizobium cremeum]MCJ8000635.1 Hsp20 family protein [Rhizobium cremeum]
MSQTKAPEQPLPVGFETVQRSGSRNGRAGDGYPPFNIERLLGYEVERLRITLAVAGFSEDELEIIQQGRELLIRGRHAERGEPVFLFRGIAARQFQRIFLLAEGMDVERAHLRNGLLSIYLFRPEPKHGEKKINISASL